MVSKSFHDYTQSPGGIEIRGLDLGETEIYSGESLAVELEVTVPPWDGGQGIDFSFELDSTQTQTQAYYWRLCRVEVVEVSDDLVCLAKGFPQFRDYLPTNWTKSDDWGKRWYCFEMNIFIFCGQVCRQG